MSNRKRSRQKQREILHWAQGGLCAGCGRPVSRLGRKPRHGPNYPTFDHFDPKRLGGYRTLENGLLKHRKCNAARGGCLPTGCDLVWHWVVVDRLRSARAAEVWGEILSH